MKIGLVCPYDIFRSGGVQEHVLAQAAELRRRGHNVKIITPKPRKHSGSVPVDIIFIGNSTKVNMAVGTSLELGINLKRDALDDILQTEEFDLLHVHEPEIPLLGAQIIAKATCPIVATFHAMQSDAPMGRTLTALRVPYGRNIYNKLNVVTAVSDVAAEFVREHITQKVHIIPNGIDLKKYSVHNTHNSQLTTHNSILFIGRLEKRKGTKYLLKSFAKLQIKYPDIELVIAGDGPERQMLEDYATKHDIKHIKFLGFIDESKKLELLASSTVFCSPALFGESFGIVLLEAMAMGTPVVAGNNPGYAIVLTGLGSDSLVDPTDTAKFAAKLATLMYDETARRKWQQWAADNIKQYSYDVVVDQYEKLYETL